MSQQPVAMYVWSFVAPELVNVWTSPDIEDDTLQWMAAHGDKVAADRLAQRGPSPTKPTRCERRSPKMSGSKADESPKGGSKGEPVGTSKAYADYLPKPIWPAGPPITALEPLTVAFEGREHKPDCPRLHSWGDCTCQPEEPPLACAVGYVADVLGTSHPEIVCDQCEDEHCMDI